jgi:TPR repeat protein
MIRLTRAVRLALAVALFDAASAMADDVGTLNPEEGGVASLAEKIRGRPETAGFHCWIAYETQKGGGGLHSEALAAMQLCAEEGNAPSMILLAHAFENGLGAPKDPVRAVLWFKQAALAGYSVGQFHYGVALREGRGVPRDEGQARFWLMQAAAQGDLDAARLLAGWPMS